MIFTHPITLPTRLFQYWNTGVVMYWLAGLGLILALGLMTFEMVKTLGDPGAVVRQAFIHSSDSQAGSPADTSTTTGDGEDEEAFPSLITSPTFTSLISYLTLPYLTGVSFYRPPLLQPPQAR